MALTDEPQGARSAGFGHEFGQFEEAAARIRELNERLLESVMAAGSRTLDAYERALFTLVSMSERADGAAPLEWLNTLAQVHADFVRDVSLAHAAALRVLLD